MAQSYSSWVLEHLNKPITIRLLLGTNTFGRHSSNTTRLTNSYISRHHAIIKIEDKKVKITCKNSYTGLYINNKKLNGATVELIAGDEISFGISPITLDNIVEESHNIFRLKNMPINTEVTETDDVIVIPDSDSDNDEEIVFLSTQYISKKPIMKQDKKVQHVTPPKLCLPVISDVKKENINNVSKDIVEVFGEPDENILTSCENENPYVYNELIKNCAVEPNITVHRLHMGEQIDLVAGQNTAQGDNDQFKINLEQEENVDDASNKILCLTINNVEEQEENSNSDVEIIDDSDDDTKFEDWKMKLSSQNFKYSQSYLPNPQFNNNIHNNSGESIQSNNDKADLNEFISYLVKKGEFDFLNELHMQSDNESNQTDAHYETESSQSSPVVQAKTKSKRTKPLSPTFDYENEATNCTWANDEQSKETAKGKLPKKSKATKPFSEKNELPTTSTKLQNTKQANKNIKISDEKITIPQSKTPAKVRERRKTICIPDQKECSKDEPQKHFNSTAATKDSTKPAQSKTPAKISKRRKTVCIDDKPDEQSKVQEAQKAPNPKPSKNLKRRMTLIDSSSKIQTPAPKKCAIAEENAKISSIKPANSLKRRMTLSDSNSKKQTPASKKCAIQEHDKASSVKLETLDKNADQSKAPAKIRARRKTLCFPEQKCFDDNPQSSSNSTSAKIKEILTEKSNNQAPIVKKSQKTEDKEISSLKLAKPDKNVAPSYTPAKIQARRKTVCCKQPDIPAKKLPVDKNVKVLRKEQLRQLSENVPKNNNTNRIQRRNSTHTLPKVKVTKTSRNDLLAIDLMEIPAYKKPKLDKKSAAMATEDKSVLKSFQSYNDDTSTVSAEQTSTTKTITETSTILETEVSSSSAIDNGSHTLFSQALLANDKLLEENAKLKNAQNIKVRERAPARSKPHGKLTFASMEKNFIESEKTEQKIKEIKSMFKNINDNNKGATKDKNTTKVKKTVRFNMTPQIFYIERDENANRKVLDGVKDFYSFSTSTFSSRRKFTIETYKSNSSEYSNQIISNILFWSNEWLDSHSAKELAANNIIMPPGRNFANLKDYQNIFFPLMKLELQQNVEREYRSNYKSFKVTLDGMTSQEDRYILFTKFPVRKQNPCKFDLVTLQFGDYARRTFAIVQNIRIGSETTTIVYEMLKYSGFSQEFIMANSQINVKPVITDIRITIATFNAIYKVKSSPLCKKILNPKSLLPKDLPKIVPLSHYRGIQWANDYQKKLTLMVYNRIVDDSKPNITLIEGPPGTGKSLIIANIAVQCLCGNIVRPFDRKLLICSQSNAAINNITRILKKMFDSFQLPKNFYIVRFGNLEKMCSTSRSLSVENFVKDLREKRKSAHLTDDNRKNLQTQKVELEYEIMSLKAHINSNNGHSTYKYNELQSKIKSLALVEQSLNQVLSANDEHILTRAYIQSASIICTTLTSSSKLSQYVDYFDVCIIDEATQCTEPNTLLPLQFKMPSLVLVGDTKQLPATVLSKKAYEYGFHQSLFSRIKKSLSQEIVSDDFMLQHKYKSTIYELYEQYRMHPEICKWPNEVFYNNKLKNAESTKTLITPLLPYSVLNLAYSVSQNDDNGKITNKVEAKFVVRLINSMKKFIPFEYNSYGIITPYSEQCCELKEELRSQNISTYHVMVNTIDSFQGMQKDVIIISTTRTRGVGFLSICERLNVALTRPKKCLILVGNFADLQGTPLWHSLIDDAKKRKIYFNLKSNCLEDFEKNVMTKIIRPEEQHQLATKKLGGSITK